LTLQIEHSNAEPIEMPVDRRATMSGSSWAFRTASLVACNPDRYPSTADQDGGSARPGRSLASAEDTKLSDSATPWQTKAAQFAG
jgi:hypothetical protein